MFCKECGKQIDDDSKFCKFCGKSLLSVNPFFSKKKEATQLQDEAFGRLSPIKNLMPEEITPEQFKELSEVIMLYDSAIKLIEDYPSSFCIEE